VPLDRTIVKSEGLPPGGLESARWESNPLLQLGRLGYYRYTTGAYVPVLYQTAVEKVNCSRGVGRAIVPVRHPDVPEGEGMGTRGEVFSSKANTAKRTYFFNVKENRTGDLFLNIVESKKSEEDRFERRSVIVFKEDLASFLAALESAVAFIKGK
jgi:hypothetical protein